MIIATVTALMILFGGGGFSFNVFEDALKKEIEDKERRKELTVEIDRADDALKEYNKELKSLSKTWAETSSRYDATREDFAPLITQADTRRMQLTSELLDARFALRDQLSAEEWAAMYERVLVEEPQP